MAHIQIPVVLSLLLQNLTFSSSSLKTGSPELSITLMEDFSNWLSNFAWIISCFVLPQSSLTTLYFWHWLIFAYVVYLKQWHNNSGSLLTVQSVAILCYDKRCECSYNSNDNSSHIFFCKLVSCFHVTAKTDWNVMILWQSVSAV